MQVELYCLRCRIITPTWNFTGLCKKENVVCCNSTQCHTSWIDDVKKPPHIFNCLYICNQVAIFWTAVFTSLIIHVLSHGIICRSHGVLSAFQCQLLKHEYVRRDNAYQVNLYSAFPVLLIVHSSIINHNIQPSKMLNYFFESTYSKMQR